MRLTPHEIDKLALHSAGVVAQKRLASGIRLNHPEAVALLSIQVMELAREGKYTVSQLMSIGTTMLGIDQVIPGVSDMIEQVQVEATFPDGTKLVTLHNPVTSSTGDLQLCLKGSFFPIPSPETFIPHSEEGLLPGAVHTLPGDILLNSGREVTSLRVMNCSDRPIQVGSHYHFIETNPMLCFDRQRSYGKRLNIAAGTAIRFEPGESKTVSLVNIGGNRIIRGGNGLCNGPVSERNCRLVMEQVTNRGFLDSASVSPEQEVKRPRLDAKLLQTVVKELQQGSHAAGRTATISREMYSHMFGPTTGDIVRLADTELYVRVERDFTVYGDECKFGGGKVLREGMGQATGLTPEEQLDTVITNALIIDYTGIYKADIGIKNSIIAGLGKAGNKDVMDGVTEGMIVGVNTEVIAGEGLIITAGGLDSHIHFICPQICTEALASGLTSLVGGGTGPAAGTCATTCTPGPVHMRLMLQATDGIPMNFGFTGKGNTADPIGLTHIIEAGAIGLKLHEDWGTTPAAIDNCLSVAEQEDVQVTIHTDTLNESCCVEGTIEAIASRTIHTYHSEGAGGGHAPDIITVCSHPNVIPSSTNPTRPLTVNTIDEHLDMLMVCHHLDSSVPEDVAFAESRIRQETIAAEDILHDLGAISIVSSDSQAMGRVGEVVCRTWQTADKMKRQRGQLREDAEADAACEPNPLPFHTSIPTLQGKPITTDNFRVKRYVAKYTINPCIAHGMSDYIGSVEIGKLADLVLWKPAFFGAKPEMVMKGGNIAWSQMGDANASIPTPQPVIMRPMFGALGMAASNASIAFASKRSISSGIVSGYGLQKRVVAVSGTRGIGKKDMKLNDATPRITVDPETYRVEADGVHLTCEPAKTIPLSQRYFLF